MGSRTEKGLATGVVVATGVGKDGREVMGEGEEWRVVVG